VHVRPVAGFTDEVRVTAALKVPEDVTVIVDVPATPAATFTEVGLAEIVKSTVAATVIVAVPELVP
jgi:hypothetical protein